MKVHLKQIPPDGLHIEGEESCPIPELKSEGISCAGPLRYNLNLGISPDALWANGRLSLPVELRCVSCLEKFVYTITVPDFALHTDIRGPETIDLTPFLREDILLSLPAYPHCDREGGRICRAAVPEPSASEKEQLAAQREHDWAELDKLKARLKH